MSKPAGGFTEIPARFDAAWYLAEYPDVAISGLDPLEHYLRYGAILGRSPGPARAPDLPATSGAPAPSPAADARRELDDSSVYARTLHALVARCRDLEARRYVAENEEALARVPLHRSDTLVSVIMPTRDRAYLIANAIESVLAQSHARWQLLVCDDGSTDNTREIVAGYADPRVEYVELRAGGAARARNEGLRRARGDVIAYLDSDNLWNPRYLERVLAEFDKGPGCCAVRANYLEVVFGTAVEITRYRPVPYSYERLRGANFIDLNSFSHRRSYYERLGGFHEDLARLQDWNLLLKYLFSRDPVSIDHALAIYRRNPTWGQISYRHAENRSPEETITQAVQGYYAAGVPLRDAGSLPSITVLSWDVSRNHFSKAYNICEAITAQQPVTLAGFRFFEDPIFPPYADAKPTFPMKIYSGGMFPGWMAEMDRALADLSGDVLYAVKPRLPSLGVALLANYYQKKPFVLESNDLESVVAAPQRGEQVRPMDLDNVDPADPALRNPHAQIWSQLLEGLVAGIPVKATHNHALDDHFGGGSFYVRNPKDEAFFDPAKHVRRASRRTLGLGEGDQVVLFSGLLREHKGVLKLLDLVRDNASRRRLLFVASRHSFEAEQIRKLGHPRVTLLDAMDRNQIAGTTAAADAVVLWLDPEFAASRYQMPFKLTDALAMKVPVLANDIGDLGLLGKQGYLRLVPFGDLNALIGTLAHLRNDGESTRSMVEAGRRLYLQQFSYAATRQNVTLAADAARGTRTPCAVAEQFASFFSRFRRTISGTR